ncbi:MAG: SAM-dependent methyltransferase [Pseudanabaena frigida]|uniref:SAM-dependent methyltransferase n=1 Tax=Pseudanabaena frigida TaxID=945775 RepID=A0A2W4VR87_9CYAN|nr:MAG: SAM-dependent methyltransferase [Pseudanabaena frigida]
MLETNSNYEYRYADNNAGHHHHYLFPSLLKLLSSVRQNDGKKIRVLDIGCGNGSLSSLIAKQGYEVVGIDDSGSGIAAANKSYPACKFIQANVYDIPYEDLGGDFDIVISAEVIEHLLYPRELIRSAKKCLKPNGSLILTTPYHGYIKNLILALTGKMEDHFTVLWDGGHIKFFSVKTLTTLLAEEEFTNFQFEFAGRFPYLWKSMLVIATF